MMAKDLLLCAVCHAHLNAQNISTTRPDEQNPKIEYESPRIILASQSEIRRKALHILGLSYECIPAHINEKAIRDPDPIKMALKISEAKAYEVAKKEQGIIIAGDAFSVFQGEVLEKPTSLDEAYSMLNKLSGNKYTFVTGLAVYDTKTKKMRSSTATCDISLRKLSKNEIIDYCNRYPVLKFAGAHECDGVVRFAERIEGSCINETAISMKDLIQFLDEATQDSLTAIM